MYCSKCGKPLSDGAGFCSYCGAPVSDAADTVPTTIPANPNGVATRVRRNETVANILWLIVGVVQVTFLYTAAAGVWNIINAILFLRNARNIVPGNPNVVSYFDNRKTGLIIMGVVNLIFGGVVGVFLVAYELHIRQVVLDNAGAFNPVAATVAAEKATADAEAKGLRSIEAVCPKCSEHYTVNYKAGAASGGVLKFTCPKCKTKLDINLPT